MKAQFSLTRKAFDPMRADASAIEQELRSMAAFMADAEATRKRNEEYYLLAQRIVWAIVVRQAAGHALPAELGAMAQQVGVAAAQHQAAYMAATAALKVK